MDSLRIERKRKREREVGNAPTSRVSRFQSVDSFPAGYENETFSLSNPSHPRPELETRTRRSTVLSSSRVSLWRNLPSGWSNWRECNERFENETFERGVESRLPINFTRWRELRWARLLRLCIFSQFFLTFGGSINELSNSLFNFSLFRYKF